MLNLVGLAVMVALGLSFGLSASYYVLLTLGSVLGAFAGFASFSRGSWFARGRGDAMTAISILLAACSAVAIGWLHGLWWGVGGFVLFWPVMYRLGVKLLVWIPEPPDLDILGEANSTAARPAVATRDEEDTAVVNMVGRPPEFDDPDEFDEWMLAGGKTYRRTRLKIGSQISREEVKKHRDATTGELYAVYHIVDGKWRRSLVTRNVFEQIRSRLDRLRGQATGIADSADSGVSRLQPPATERSLRRENRWKGGRVHLVLPPLPPHLQGQSGALFQSYVFSEEVGEGIALLLIDDPEFAKQLGALTPFHLNAKCGAVRTSAGMIAFILWSVSSRNGHVVDYEHTLDPFSAGTTEMLHSVARQRYLKVIVLDSVHSETEGFREFENNFGMDDLVSALTQLVSHEPPADFEETHAALRAEFSLEDLKNA